MRWDRGSRSYQLPRARIERAQRGRRFECPTFAARGIAAGAALQRMLCFRSALSSQHAPLPAPCSWWQTPWLSWALQRWQTPLWAMPGCGACLVRPARAKPGREPGTCRLRQCLPRSGGMLKRPSAEDASQRRSLCSASKQWLHTRQLCL